MQSFIAPGDIIVSETGTSNFGICDIGFPANITLVTQIYYGSIGFATAATLGADVARREMETVKTRERGRTILLTGDGSMALTIQEIGTMIKAQSKAVLFVINNKGYTIERLIWGARQGMFFCSFFSPCFSLSSLFLHRLILLFYFLANGMVAYNDIVPHDYAHLLPLYHHPDPASSFHRATTKEELTAILAKPQLRHPECLQLVELVLDKLDTSWKLGTTLAWRSDKHKEYLTEEGFVDTYGGWGLDGAAGGSVKWS